MDQIEFEDIVKRLEQKQRKLTFGLIGTAIVAGLALVIAAWAITPILMVEYAFHRAFVPNGTFGIRTSAEPGPALTPVPAAAASEAGPLASPQPPPSPEPDKLLSALGVTVVAKRVLAKNPSAEQFSDEVELTITAANLSDRKIRAFEGGIDVEDLLGNPIMALKLVEQAPFDPHATKRLTRYWEINQFDNDETRFEAEDFNNLRFQLDPIKIIFADGTILVAGH